MDQPYSNELKQMCTNCRQSYPVSKIQLHEVYCCRNIRLCNYCGQLVDNKDKESHNLSCTKNSVHQCDKCKSSFENLSALETHIKILCNSRIVNCIYCKIETQASDILQHGTLCGSKLQSCSQCGNKVETRELNDHEIGCKALKLREKQKDQSFKSNILDEQSTHKKKEVFSGQSEIKIGGNLSKEASLKVIEKKVEESQIQSQQSQIKQIFIKKPNDRVNQQPNSSNSQVNDRYPSHNIPKTSSTNQKNDYSLIYDSSHYSINNNLNDQQYKVPKSQNCYPETQQTSQNQQFNYKFPNQNRQTIADNKGDNLSQISNNLSYQGLNIQSQGQSQTPVIPNYQSSIFSAQTQPASNYQSSFISSQKLPLQVPATIPSYSQTLLPYQPYTSNFASQIQVPDYPKISNNLPQAPDIPPLIKQYHNIERPKTSSIYEQAQYNPINSSQYDFNYSQPNNSSKNQSIASTSSLEKQQQQQSYQQQSQYQSFQQQQQQKPFQQQFSLQNNNFSNNSTSLNYTQQQTPYQYSTNNYNQIQTLQDQKRESSFPKNEYSLQSTQNQSSNLSSLPYSSFSNTYFPQKTDIITSKKNQNFLKDEQIKPPAPSQYQPLDYSEPKSQSQNPEQLNSSKNIFKNQKDFSYVGTQKWY